jgi:hypothetical protein
MDRLEFYISSRRTSHASMPSPGGQQHPSNPLTSPGWGPPLDPFFDTNPFPNSEFPYLVHGVRHSHIFTKPPQITRSKTPPRLIFQGESISKLRISLSGSERLFQPKNQISAFSTVYGLFNGRKINCSYTATKFSNLCKLDEPIHTASFTNILIYHSICKLC